MAPKKPAAPAPKRQKRSGNGYIGRYGKRDIGQQYRDEFAGEEGQARYKQEKAKIPTDCLKPLPDSTVDATLSHQHLNEPLPTTNLVYHRKSQPARTQLDKITESSSASSSKSSDFDPPKTSSKSFDLNMLAGSMDPQSSSSSSIHGPLSLQDGANVSSSSMLHSSLAQTPSWLLPLAASSLAPYVPYDIRIKQPLPKPVVQAMPQSSQPIPELLQPPISQELLQPHIPPSDLQVSAEDAIRQFMDAFAASASRIPKSDIDKVTEYLVTEEITLELIPLVTWTDIKELAHVRWTQGKFFSWKIYASTWTV